jgi:two-component system, OmpR family, phosphate regulon response regulator PhoB
MQRVTILATDREAACFDTFDHGDVVCTFDLLTPQGPKRLIEGQIWAFVDWVTDELSGLEMCRRLRADTRLENAHITIVLESDDPDDRRRALRAGADDYLLGPLDRQKMLDRVLALHSSDAARHAPQVIDLGDLKIDIAAQQARWQGKSILLRPNEFRLLRFMAENPNRVLSRQQLIEALGKEGNPNYLRTVDVWIKRLRKGLRDAGAGHLLRTVHVKCYVLDAPV